MSSPKYRQPKRGKAVLFLRNISRNTKDGFKAYCYRRGVTMQRAIEEFMVRCLVKEQSYQDFIGSTDVNNPPGDPT